MSIVVRFHPTNLTKETYDESVRLLEEKGAWPPDGLDYHVSFGPDGDMKVSEVWDSQERLEAFGEVLMPILLGQGMEFSSEPDVLEIHAAYRR